MEEESWDKIGRDEKVIMKEKKIKKKIRVLQVNKLYDPFTGGIEQVVKQLAEGLSGVVNMHVLVCQKRGRTRYERKNQVTICRAASVGMIGNLPIPVALISQFQLLAKKADLVQFHMPFPFGDLAGLLSGYSGKIVVWWHSDIVRQKKMMFFYRPFMERFLQRADRIIVATEGHIEGSEFLQPYRKKCVIIPFGVNRLLEEQADRYWEQYLMQKKLLEETKELNQEKEKGLCFLFVGRLVYYKGCEVLIKAFADLKKESKKAHQLVLVGNGRMEKELKELARQKGIAKAVRFAGAVTKEQLYQEYKDCDVFVLPSIARSEAFGLVQIEAMAFGKPVINTRLDSGVPYVSLDQVTGLTVTPNQVTELKEAMLYMERNPVKRIQMGEQARQRMKEEYRENVMLERVLQLYQELLQENREKKEG